MNNQIKEKMIKKIKKVMCFCNNEGYHRDFIGGHIEGLNVREISETRGNVRDMHIGEN